MIEPIPPVKEFVIELHPTHSSAIECGIFPGIFITEE
jgi:hypothetical protein